MQTCVEEVENAEYATPQKPLLSMTGEGPLDEELDPRSRLREYGDSTRRLVAKKRSYAKPTRRSWPMKQGSMGDIYQLKEDLEQKITTWQREVDLKLMKSVWCAHVRTPEEDELSAYANPLERAYAATGQRTLCNGTFYTPIKGWRILPRTLSRLRITSLLVYTKGQAIYTLTRTWRTRSISWTLEYRS